MGVKGGFYITRQLFSGHEAIETSHDRCKFLSLAVPVTYIELVDPDYSR